MRGKILLLLVLLGAFFAASCSGGGGGSLTTQSPKGTGTGPTITQHITSSVGNPSVGQSSTFTAAAVGTGVTYSWTADGGSFASQTGASVQWSAPSAGTYHVTVTATDVSGHSATDTYTITVGSGGTTGGTPVFSAAGIGKKVSADLIGETYTFTAEATDPGNDLSKFTWDDGTGTNHGTFSGQKDTIDTPAGHGTSTVKWTTTAVGTYTITCKATDQANESATATLTISPATVTSFSYVSKETCKMCHADKVSSWSGTKHASAWDDLNAAGSGNNKNCVGCHTAGFAGGGGYDNIGGGFINPTITPQFENVQCEDCHGPSTTMKVSWNPADNCGTCHNGTHNPQFPDWQKSGHNYDMSSTTETPFLNTGCVKCHNGQWFVNIQIDGGAPPAANLTADQAVNIVCATCHDPHDATNPYQLRTVAPATISYDPTNPVDGGLGNLCMHCHGDRRTTTDRTNQIASGNSHLGPHHNTQGAMLYGLSGFEYPGQTYTNSPHSQVVADTCVTCHMHSTPYQAGPPAVPSVSGHEFKPDVVVCQTCHPGATSFDIGGAQTDITNLLNQLLTLLPKQSDGVTVDTSSAVTVKQRQAEWNYYAVLDDGSNGVHNYAYAKKLLQDSISDLNTP